MVRVRVIVGGGGVGVWEGVDDGVEGGELFLDGVKWGG